MCVPKGIPELPYLLTEAPPQRSLEQIVNQNRSAEQFIFALFSMFDKYIDIPDNDNNNIRPS